jgi:hypothetical protein
MEHRPMQIVILADGVCARSTSPIRMAEVSMIAKTADDITMHDLRICPDLDTIMNTVGGDRVPRRRKLPRDGGVLDSGPPGRYGLTRGQRERCQHRLALRRPNIDRLPIISGDRDTPSTWNRWLSVFHTASLYAAQITWINLGIDSTLLCQAMWQQRLVPRWLTA